MSNGNLQNEFIEFRSNLGLLTNRMVVKSIYVRESYKTLTKLISDAFTEEGVKSFVVTGTPGIGKTIFLHYFLWVLITRQTSINDQVDRKIYLQRSNRRIYSFQGDKTVSIDAGVAEDTVLHDKNCILLVDMVDENEPVLCRGTTIIFSSPNPKRYKQLANEISCRFILNCWTLEELKAVWLHSYQDLPWKDVKRIYDKMGGVIRYVLEQNKVANKRMEEGIRKSRNMFIDTSKTINQHISFGDDGPMIYRLVHIFSLDHSFDNSKFEFASKYARKECLKGLKAEEIDRVMAFLKYNTANDAQGYRGNLFEPFVHKFVAEFGLPNIKRLSNAEYNDTDANSLLRSFALQDGYKLHCNGVASKIPAKFSEISDVKIEKEIYYQPNKRNFASIDSFFIKNNDVFAFQITVGTKKNGVKASGLQKLYDIVNKTFANMNYHIVFLCPAGEKNSINFKAVKIADVSGLYAKYKDIPENAQRFEGNQWISMIDIRPSYEKIASS